MKTKSRWLLFVQTVLCTAGILFFAMSEQTAKAADTNYPDNLKAGAALILDADITEDDEVLVAYAMELNGSEAAKIEETVKEEEEEQTLVMVDVDNILNVRADASADAEIVGALYADCGGQILERKNGWTRISSGNLTGWAKDEYLLFGDEAVARAAEVGVNQATSLTGGLRIRKEPSMDAGVYGFMAKGDIVTVSGIEGDWVKIEYEGYEGYVSAEYVEVEFLIDEGETLEEIAQREAAEAEAKAKAEEEAAERRERIDAEKAYIAANYSEAEILGALIWCESGNQPYEGQLAVGAVVMNRVKCPRYPGTIIDVIFAPGQFTPALNGRVLKALERGVNPVSLQAAQEALNGGNNIGDLMHFNGVGTHDGGVVIGGHIFW